MLAKRVILCLTFDEGVLMRTKRFRADLRYTQAYSCSDDADEIVLLDITRSGPWPGFPGLAEAYCRRLQIPAICGGHVRSWEYARTLLNAGSFAVVVGWRGRDCYEEIASQVGSQSLVAGIDIENPPQGREAMCAEDGPNVCREAEARGAGEILLTSIDRDGSLSGFDCEMVRQCAPVLGIPLVIAGGAGSWSHFKEAFEAGASGAVTTNIYHQNNTAMRSCKQWLAANYSGAIRPAEGTSAAA